MNSLIVNEGCEYAPDLGVALDRLGGASFGYVPVRAKKLERKLSGQGLEKAYHLLETLSRNSLNSKGEPNFHPISWKDGVASYGRFWNEALNFLIGKGFIERDHYQTGSKSYGYRLTKPLWKAEMMLYEYRSKAFQRRLDKQRDDYAGQHYTALEWTLQAHIEALTFPRGRFISVLLDIAKAYTGREVLRKQQRAFVDCSNLIAGIFPNIKRSKTNHRLNHALTSCKKEIRPHLQLYGEEVAIFDIVNSQPFLAACVLGDKGAFMQDTMSGAIYEKIMKITRQSRGKVKKSVMACLYRHEVNGTCKPWTMANYKHKAVMEAINKLYPNVLSKIDAIRYRTGQDNGFAIMMQRLEASIMIDGVLAKAQARHLPAIPIHDAMLVRASDAQEMKELIASEYQARVKCVPCIRLEQRGQ